MVCFVKTVEHNSVMHLMHVKYRESCEYSFKSGIKILLVFVFLFLFYFILFPFFFWGGGRGGAWFKNNSNGTRSRLVYGVEKTPSQPMYNGTNGRI